jgi:Zn-dependent peptidase ImmA (M78 family)
MGVKGRRIITGIEEPTLLGDIDSIINDARTRGFISDYLVNIEAIIKSFDIAILKEDLPSTISGYLKKFGDKWTIGINKNHHIRRQRFTLAHEFAHFCLHRSDNGFFEDTIFFRDENLTSIEYAANTFAANLLMPEEAVRNLIRSGIVTIKDLSEKFNISTLAMKNRVISLGYKIKDDEE